MTREEALAYLRFEAELMAELREKQRKRRRNLELADIPEQLVELADRAYRQAMDDVKVFNSLTMERHGAWDAIHIGVTATEYAGS